MTRQRLRRRTVLRGIGGAAIGTTLAGTATAQGTSGDWPTFGYDAGNTGYNPNNEGITVDIEKKWRFDAQAPLTSAPTIVGDTVYANSTGGQVYSVTNAGNTQIYTLGGGGSGDGSTPEQVQSRTSTPTVVDGSLYVGGLDGVVYAIDVESQSQQWSFDTGGVVRSSPVVVDGTLYVGSASGAVVAIDVVDGSEQWRFETGRPVVASPAVVDGTALVGSENGVLYGLGASDGGEQWRYEAGAPVYAAPVSDGNRVYAATSGGTVAAVSVADGSESWTESVGETITAAPTLAAGGLHIGTYEGTIVQIDPDSGTQQWEATPGGTIRGGLAASADTVYVGTADGTLAALGIADGESHWSFGVDGGVTAPVAVANNRLYFGTKDGRLFALGEPSGWETLPVTALRTGREMLNTYGEEAAGVVGGSVAVVGGYVGARRLRDRLAPDGKSSSVQQGEARPIGVDRPEIAATKFPDLSGVEYDQFDRSRLIGSGGNADVHEATVEINGSEYTVALKIPRMSDYDTVDTKFFDEFVEEARVWDNIDDHDNIVTVLGWDQNPYPWIGLEHMDAGNLDEMMDELGHDEMFVHLEEMAEAVHHAHRQGITHTDLKPENVLFTTHEGRRVAKIADWGLATVLLDHSTSVKGLTPAYSAPEQIDPESYGGTDDRTDIYQLGAVAYELFTGDVPFDRSNYSATMNAVLNESPTSPSELDSSLPESLDNVLLRALSKRKDDRYETVLHFRDALRRVYHA